VSNRESGVLLAPGLKLQDRYEIVGPISSGAMGAVYRALDTETGAHVAIKHLLDTSQAERFEVEARLLSALRHPRVVHVLHYFATDNGQYLVMDLVEGTDLGVVLDRQGNPGLPLEEAIQHALQACEALQYVHDQQIVHRDVKPRNLILGGDGIVLVDFGVARAVSQTDDGTVGVGTPRYMAPEVFAGGTVSPRADVYGLAATLWTLLAGRTPVYADPTRLTELVPGLPPELEQTVRAGLEVIPERRVSSAAGFAKALGTPLRRDTGESLALSVERPDAPRNLLEGIVRTAAGVFEAAASSIALTDGLTGELVFQSAWGAGAREIVGVRLPPGEGIAGSVLRSGEAQAVADCRSDRRFSARIAAGTGYVPVTMLVVPLRRAEQPIGVLSLLDRRGGGRYDVGDIERATLFAELAVTALEVDPTIFRSLGTAVGHRIR
jgi:hypothetical protein